jgi:hypothetical protein
MNIRTIASIARPLRKSIGAHHRMIGTLGWTHDEYMEAQRLSDEAVLLAKYLIQHLDDRHAAVMFASAVGMPGYINMR